MQDTNKLNMVSSGLRAILVVESENASLKNLKKKKDIFSINEHLKILIFNN